jgi:HEPN domain-containing protein
MKNQRKPTRRRAYPTAEDWMEKAREDLAFAGAGLRETEHYTLVLFHCQQAVEKSLKAYLIHVDKRFGKVHFLSTLLALASSVDATFRQFQDACRALDKYYIVTRYPVDWTAIYTRTEARRGLDQAQEILDFIESKIETSGS